MADTLFKHYMMAVYDESILAQPSMFLSNMFGKNPSELYISETEKIDVDVIRDSRELAVDVSRGGAAGNKNESNRFTAHEYQVPLYWEEAAITAGMLNKRLPGFDPFQSVDRMQALAYHAGKIQSKQALKIRRAMEYQAAQAFLTGKITLVNSDTRDFKKKATHHATPSTKWAPTAGTPISDIQTLADIVFHDGKLKPDTLIFGATAFTQFIGNDKVLAYLNTRYVEPGRLAPGDVVQGAKLWGRLTIGQYVFDIYIYDEFYQTTAVPPVATPYVTTDSVIMLNRAARLVKAFGAVEILPQFQDEYRRLGMPMVPEFQPGQIMPFAYEKPPAALMAGVQSAPVMIPTAIDTFGDLYNVD